MPNIYTESCTDSNELSLVADSLEKLIFLINNDKVDTENCYLIKEADLSPEQRDAVGIKNRDPDYDFYP